MVNPNPYDIGFQFEPGLQQGLMTRRVMAKECHDFRSPLSDKQYTIPETIFPGEPAILNLNVSNE